MSGAAAGPLRIESASRAHSGIFHQLDCKLCAVNASIAVPRCRSSPLESHFELSLSEKLSASKRDLRKELEMQRARHWPDVIHPLMRISEARQMSEVAHCSEELARESM